MHSVVVGIDPSSRKLAAVWTVGDTPPQKWVRTLSHIDLGERCAKAYYFTENLLARIVLEHPKADMYFFVEEPALGRGGAHSTISQAKVQGAVLAALCGSQGPVTVRTVVNTHWKKKVVGKGNADKPEIAAWARAYWGQLHRLAKGDQDVIDAGAINRYGVGVLETMRKIDNHRKKEGRIVRRRIRI